MSLSHKLHVDGLVLGGLAGKKEVGSRQTLEPGNRFLLHKCISLSTNMHVYTSFLNCPNKLFWSPTSYWDVFPPLLWSLGGGSRFLDFHVSPDMRHWFLLGQ